MKELNEKNDRQQIDYRIKSLAHSKSRTSEPLLGKAGPESHVFGD